MHELHVDQKADKPALYASLIPQIKALTEGETNLYANLANITAALHQTFRWWWVGFYLVQEQELVLGPFQGPVACSRIGFGKGVCGKTWEAKQTILVDDVEKFPGHIACSNASRSEIVVPIMKHNQVVAVLDVDSEHLAYFDATDKLYLEELGLFIASLF